LIAARAESQGPAIRKTAENVYGSPYAPSPSKESNDQIPHQATQSDTQGAHELALRSQTCASRQCRERSESYNKQRNSGKKDGVVNLFLACVWAILASAFFIWQAYPRVHDHPGFMNPSTAGWAALIMTAYNLVRWWMRRIRKSGITVGRNGVTVASAPAVTDPQFKIDAMPDSDGPPNEF
jgi:hypothetical protein